MASTTLAHVDNIVMRFSKATFGETELLKSISILIIENMKSSMALLEKGHTQRRDDGEGGEGQYRQM